MGITSVAQEESIDPGPGVAGSNDELATTVLHPPHQPVGSGKPAYVKRGPGRPRKENAVGLGKVHKLGLSSHGHNKAKSLFSGMPGPSLNRGMPGRKKNDGLISAGGTNLAVSYIGELSAISHESPPRGGGGDDAAESDTSSVASSLEKLHEDFSLLPEQWPGKVCAFCNLGERSMLGQGDLLRIEIPESFDPVAVSAGLTLKKTEKDTNPEKAHKPGFSCRRQKGSGKIKRLISQSSLESMNEPVDEVCGYPEEPEYNTIYDATSGYYYVHHGCANWCDGVHQTEDGSLTNLDVEVVRSLGQRCAHCGNFGAGVSCKGPKCGAAFHFPCAAISGAFQDPSSKTVLCSSHVDLAVSLFGDKASCTVCDSPGKISSLLMCSSCGNHYHGICLALNCDPSIRAGWQCPACKMCQACRQPGDDGKLLPCDTCDKWYHIFCLRPALSSIPKHSWKCKLCRMCTDCGARTPGSGPSSRWHANFSVCDSCYQQRNKGLACPMCGKAYRHVAQKLMLQCHLCKKYVHGTCDPAADLVTYQQRKGQHPDYAYVCIPCKSQPSGPQITTPGGTPRVLSSAKRTSDDLGFDDNSVFNNNTSSQDTLFSPEDDSIQSVEISSNDLSWQEKSTAAHVDDKQHQTPHHHHHHHQTPKENKLLNHEAKLHKRKSLGGGGRVKGMDRLGQYSTNNNRRHKVTEFVKKRGPKPKLRMFSTGRVHRASTDSFPKEEEGQVGVENRMILCSARDDFVLQQDVCVMCGAYGNDLEGRLIACAQCGQCYHPYCVNVKVNRVILTKGWRCLDCTVCEGCGQRNDEARLILCDECDVSFHIYCMDPPLDSVPQGTWKCKWCVVCQYCGSNDPGKNSIWHNNYTTCGPCASYTTCPVCKLDYTDGEMIIKCFKCDRWIHANCDSIKDDDDAEKCSDENYNCVLCRPHDVLPPHMRPPPPPIVTKVEHPPKSPDLLRSTSQFNVDGVCLSDAGMSHIKSLTMDYPRKKRKKMPNIADMEAGILAAIESVVSGGDDKVGRDDKNDDANEKDKEAKKRQRNLQKLGIGGFIVRLRGPRFKDDDDISLDSIVDGDKPKRKAQRRKVKNKLVENFPVYLQEAFFGKTLLEPSSKETDLVSTEDAEETTPSIKNENIIKLSKEEIKEIEAIKAKQKTPEKLKHDNRQVSVQSAQHSVPDVSKEIKKLQPPIVDEDENEIALQDILGGDLLDNDFMDNIMEGDDIKVEEGLVDFRHVNPKDEFNDILTGQFGLDIDPGLPSMDSKDVEDIFKGVLIEESQENLFSDVSTVPTVSEVASTSTRGLPNPGVPPSSITVSSPSSGIPPNITTTCQVQASPGLPRATPMQQNLQSPVNFPPPSPYPSEYSNSPQFSPAFSEPQSPWPAAQADDSDQSGSYNQRSNMLNREADEALGANATISCVLYANINHPELKRDYANWNDRAKQISKIWRSLSAEKKAPYLQKARENRAALRMQKAQQIPKDRVGDGVALKDVNALSHSPDCEAHVKANMLNAGGAIIKTEMDLDSDQDKLSAGQPKTARVETHEERQWKQMQAHRQQLQHQQQQQQPGVMSDQRVVDHKDGVIPGSPVAMGGTPPMPFSPGPVGMGVTQRMMMPGSPGQGGIECVRPPLQSPHSPSPMGRPPFPNLQMGRPRPPMTVAMPPPSPSGVYPPRQEVPTGAQNIRGSLYSRLPFTHQPRPGISLQNDVYGNPPTPQSDGVPHSPLQPRPFEETMSPSEPYAQKVLPDQFSHSPVSQQSAGEQDNVSRPSPSPQTPEAKQHLRGLLQRQQFKRLEQEQMPQSPDMPSLNRPPAPWQHDDPTKLQVVDNQIAQRLGVPGQVPGPSKGVQMGEFRQPLLPTHIRVPANVALSPHGGQRPMGDFRLGTPGAPTQIHLQNMDPRARILLQHQQRGILVQSQQGIPQRPPGFNQFPGSGPLRNSLDPYDHLVVQQQRMVVPGPGVTVSSSSSMLAQQLVRPLNTTTVQQLQPPSSSPQLSPHPIHSVHQPSPMVSGVPTSEAQQPNVSPSTITSDHQELPDSVTEELEKLEQEHNDHGVEAEASELTDLGMDDDELLIMGDDFNILEYADSELDDVVGGGKTNILDNLDLEEDDKEEKDLQQRKDVSDKVDKKMGIGSEYSRMPKTSGMPKVKEGMTSQASAIMSSSNNSSSSNSNFIHASAPAESPGKILRPTQVPPPPPPYPGPPPPYPGRPQEQPLLLEDLLEQEKREQQKQLPAPGLMGAAPEEPLLSDFDFERLKADVLSSSNLPVSLSPPNIVGQSVGMQPQQGVFVRSAAGLSQVHTSQSGNWPMDPGPNGAPLNPPPQQGTLDVSINVHGNLQGSIPGAPNQPGQRIHLTPVPPPPNPPEHPTTEQERQQQVQYEQWLYHQQNVLTMQQKCVETDVAKLRKQKKSINCKVRQLKKTGAQLSEPDNSELERINRELPVLQKQLDQVRKQIRQHGNLTNDYRAKQQKKQQQMMGNQGPQPQTQMSPLGPTASSPLHSTPQSPMLCSSPSMSGPSPSPLMQHSPMASPLTPSPGPHSATLSQTSPRVVVNPGQHQMDDGMPFSPSSDPNMRPMLQQLPQNRLPGQPQGPIRMGSPNVTSHQQIIVSQSGNVNQPSQGIMIVRGINPNMIPMHQQRAVGFVDNQGMRVRAVGSQEQMKILTSMSPRFQRVGITQDVLARVKGPQSFPNSQQMPMSPGGQHYVSARVPFPTQSPNSANMNMGMTGNMRSPSPMTPMAPMTPVGGLGSPPNNQVMMVQNRVSPASSPMRRPSGSSSIGAPSPMTDRPQSVENPLTPRSTAGSRPHTPIGSNMMQCHTPGGMMDGMQPNHPPQMEAQFTLEGADTANVHVVQSFPGSQQHPYSCAQTPPTHGEYIVTSAAGGGGGGGGPNHHQVLPFPTFSWAEGVSKMGLKGGSPFSVINEAVPTSTPNPTPEEVTQTTITVSNSQPEETVQIRVPVFGDGESSSSQSAVVVDGQNSSATTEPIVVAVKSSVNSVPVATATTSVPNQATPVQQLVSTPDNVNSTNATTSVTSLANSSSQPVVSVSNSIAPNVNAQESASVPKAAVSTTSSVVHVNSVQDSLLPLTVAVNSHPPPPPPVVATIKGPVINSIPVTAIPATVPPKSTVALNLRPAMVNSQMNAIKAALVTAVKSAPVMAVKSAPPPVTAVKSVSVPVTAVKSAPVLQAPPQLLTSLPSVPLVSSVSSSSSVQHSMPVVSIPASVAVSTQLPPPSSSSFSNALPASSALPPVSFPSSTLLAPLHSQPPPHPIGQPSSIPIAVNPASNSGPHAGQTIATVTFVPPTSVPLGPPQPTAIPSMPPTPVLAQPQLHGNPTAAMCPPPPSQNIVTGPVPPGPQHSGGGGVGMHQQTLVPSMISSQPSTVVAFTSVPLSTFSSPTTMPTTLGVAQSISGNAPSSATLIFTNQMNSQYQGSNAPPNRVQLPVQVSAPVQHQISANNVSVAMQQATGTISLPPTMPPNVHTLAIPTTHGGIPQHQPNLQHQQQHVLMNDALNGNLVSVPNMNIPTVVPNSAAAAASLLQGESQNALLKQLLQNTGCASMTQASETVGFSLTSCLPARPAPGSSHLSEAATRIPHPTPVPVRPATPVTPTMTALTPPLTRPVIKSEPMMVDECSQGSTSMCGTPPVVEPDVKPVLLPEPIIPPVDTTKEAIIAVVREAAEQMMQNDKIVSDQGSTTSIGPEGKKSDEDAKKLKRRQYQAKRKQSMTNKESPVSKKRPRKVGRAEDDFDGFLDSFMTQLRQLSPIGIVEPELSYNYNACSVYGTGDFTKLTQKTYSTFHGDLGGAFGRGNLPTKSDFYNSRPFGNDTPRSMPKPPPTHRGFYYQEFATPKLGTFAEKTRTDNRTPSPVRETDTPDTIVSASSPECTSWENFPMYPGLRFIDEDMDRDLERCISPEIPLLVPIPIRPVPVDKTKDLTKDIKDMDKENKNGVKDGVNGTKLRSFTPLKEAGNITVTLTLSSAAAEDIRGLLRNLASVLSIAAPTYQVIDKAGATISEQKSHLYTIKGKDGKEKIDMQSILNGAAKFCRHCDVVVLNNVIKKKVSDFPGVQSVQLNGGESSEDFYFCSTTCFMQFSITHGVTITEEKAAAIVAHPGDTKTIKSELKLKESKKNKLLGTKAAEAKLQKTKIKEEVIDGKIDKKWKGNRYRNWGSTFLPPTKYKKPTDKEVTETLFRLGITAMPSKIPLDIRECIFCHFQGDGLSDGPGRLLNFDVDKWVHLNCGLWSDDVYETENGALVNVELALKQSLTSACVFCKQKGATVKCFKTRCSQVYHLGCARKDGCIFYKNKTIYCPTHIPKGEKENELATLSVYRRVYIQRDENKQVAAVMHHVDQHHLLRVGSLIFLSVGQLLPHQLQAFHTPSFIYPIGYKISRFYWSMRKVNKRCQYVCSIHDLDGKPEFRITTQEEGYKEQVVKGDTAQAAWLHILEAISKLRNNAEIIKVFPKYITGEDLFGLTEPAIVKVLESLPGIETLTDYHFKYGRNPLLELPLAINPTGCARAEPKLRTHFKRPHTQRTGPSRATTYTTTVISSEAACPYSKQFVHSKSSQYKKMKMEWRNNVYLARSKIQGLGLYAARDIEKHTMVIEYIGEIIRSELAELREKKYEAQNRGIYMFRMDENRVIDATLCGGLARYINHSCNPNCVAETVEVDRDLRIIIFANRRISRGEELAYDYKFEVEDDQHKIPCLCGAPNCQQWMN